MKKIENKTFDAERALYRAENCIVENCTFAGPADGESALKETRDIAVCNCKFYLRYPLWHAQRFELSNCVFEDTSRAPLWYDVHGKLTNCKVLSIKPLRECDDVTLSNCDLSATETGWKCKNLVFDNCRVRSEYFLLDSQNVKIHNMQMEGKYSFQYVRDLVIENSVLNTKDAFWHTENVTVKNCKVIGEYLGWYSKNLTFINCEICGTQPLCYCENLTLQNCTMTDCDLSFEYSDVNAQVGGHILSVKNPKSGKIVADTIGEIILQDSLYPTNCEIVAKNDLQ